MERLYRSPQLAVNPLLPKRPVPRAATPQWIYYDPKWGSGSLLFMNKKPIGNKQRIEAATGKAEVEALLRQVKSYYTHASAKTIRACERAARKRIKEVA